MLIGAHIWINKGLASAVETANLLGCNCFQIFLQNPRSWKRKKRDNNEVMKFREKVKSYKISPVVIHMPYILNLSSPEKGILKKSRELFEYEMMEAEELNADYYIIHPGSHKGAGIDAGIKNLTESIKPFVRKKPEILIENTAGQGDTIGGRWEDFVYLFEKLEGDIGICFDTAHSFQAGYDIKDKEVLLDMLEKIDRILIRKGIFVIHANDSLSPLGSHLDRHQHIGKGYLGKETFELLIRNEYLGALPFIIETPKEDMDMDKKNLNILKDIGFKYHRI
ncbi:MAG: deoxyribonuclease IV [Candidatus Omnitrophica bacterium]|nr:deoxyribonuclease IV [Candidatus Omnitrophota bacterium]